VINTLTKEKIHKEAQKMMTQQEWEIYLLHYEEGLKQEQIAEALNINQATVSRKLERAGAIMKHILQKNQK
jgi:RNA polymerase sigma factor (sigma-70 family)